MVPERPGLENEAASSTMLGRTPALEGTAKASQSQRRVLHEKLASVGTDRNLQALSVGLRLPADGCVRGCQSCSSACVSERKPRPARAAGLPAAPCFWLPRIYLHNQRPWWPDDLGLVLARWPPSWINKVITIKRSLLCAFAWCCPELLCLTHFTQQL